ncbi:energy-coupling factor transporter ATPase [Neobittarella massiliensis]|uniref:Energy-coupling factor transporter ATP-binding protein EcfA2 n=1 Tax=uncultured Anaerotruncus sp. TaxID=905011 RepID=A0A1C6K4W2_9FIRM|nr:energy-coupling factor transporter ATPase [Neobittarella massiliensis]SCJ89389.1 Energy-coupling factor transporter ATP-binding protein EcfA2 [uncultured Anaerotruncus sp.]
MAIIKTTDLTYIYNAGLPTQTTAIKDINIEIEEGAFVGVIGHTGSGKSTLIQHLNGLLRPTSGKVYIDGRDIWAHKEQIRQVRFDVGLVFQYPEYQLFEETVYKDIAFGPGNMDLSDSEIDSRVKQAAEAVELSPADLQKSPFELSGGQKRRAAIAGVLAMEPKILILDEPTAGLDPRGRDTILKLITRYHQEKKNTILLVSHSMEDVAKFASKVLVMSDTGVLMYDTVQAVFSHAQQIRQIGLSIPQITQIFIQLADRGYPVPRNVYSVEQGVHEIQKLLQGREGGKP